MWRYQNDNGLSSAYRSLHIDTSRKNLGYPDHPIPDHYPDFLSHAEVMEWLESYAQRFDLKRHFRFNCQVERIAPEGDGAWRVALAGGETRRYRAVIVANGHLWDPRRASFPGSFDGEQLHSHDYRTAEPFAGKNVLVVGIGNSAVDIAVDVCKSASRTFLSTRRSAWVMPKYIMGIPVDRWSGFFGRKLHLPTPVARTLVRWLAFLAVGDQTRFGVPRPQHAIWREHATLSQELLPYCGHGWIRMKPNVRELRGDQVAFDDGSNERIDAIILATGYRTSFPFLDRALFEVTDGVPALYRRMTPPQLRGLYFVGLVQPVGPTIPLAEVQSRWLAAHLSGAMRLPERRSDAARDRPPCGRGPAALRRLGALRPRGRRTGLREAAGAGHATRAGRQLKVCQPAPSHCANDGALAVSRAAPPRSLRCRFSSSSSSRRTPVWPPWGRGR